MSRILIRGGTLYDPKKRTEGRYDLLIDKGRIVKISDQIPSTEAPTVLDVKGLAIFPGFIDLHAHFREPGEEHKEDLESGSRSALAGGFVAVCVMPNTRPPLSDRSRIEYIRSREEELRLIKILPVGTITKERVGKELAELLEMRDAGAVAFSDDGAWVADGALMRHALEYSRWLHTPIVSHAEDPTLARGVMHEGEVSDVLGLKGRPRISEDVAVFRDLALAELTGGYLHVAHVSSYSAARLIWEAKQRGVHVTAEVTPHHLTFTDERLRSFDTRYKVNPPLREEQDRRALIEALKEGVIDVVATDHAPHTDFEKEADFLQAPPGMIGIQWAFAQLYTFLVLTGEVDLWTLLDALTWKPAKILGEPQWGQIQEGYPAHLTLVDLQHEWVLEERRILSKSKNTPLLGEKLRGWVRWTMVAGKLFSVDDLLG